MQGVARVEMREEERGCSFAKGAVLGLFSLRSRVGQENPHPPTLPEPRPRAEWEQQASGEQEQGEARVVSRSPPGEEMPRGSFLKVELSDSLKFLGTTE